MFEPRESTAQAIVAVRERNIDSCVYKSVGQGIGSGPAQVGVLSAANANLVVAVATFDAIAAPTAVENVIESVANKYVVAVVANQLITALRQVREESRVYIITVARIDDVIGVATGQCLEGHLISERPDNDVWTSGCHR